MDGVEVIDLCSESKTEIGERCKGKESPKQESRDKTKINTIIRKKGKIRPGESKSTTKNEENETAMMCWEVLNDFLKKEEKPIGKTQKRKHEEEHVKPTLIQATD